KAMVGAARIEIIAINAHSMLDLMSGLLHIRPHEQPRDHKAHQQGWMEACARDRQPPSLPPLGQARDRDGPASQERRTARDAEKHRAAGAAQAKVINMRDYIGIVHKDRGSDYGVSFPDLPGCISAASSIEELREMAAEALGGHLAAMAETGEAIPVPSTIE